MNVRGKQGPEHWDAFYLEKKIRMPMWAHPRRIIFYPFLGATSSSDLVRNVEEGEQKVSKERRFPVRGQTAC